jgi:hypothetical protein
MPGWGEATTKNAGACFPQFKFAKGEVKRVWQDFVTETVLAICMMHRYLIPSQHVIGYMFATRGLIVIVMFLLFCSGGKGCKSNAGHVMLPQKSMTPAFKFNVNIGASCSAAFNVGSGTAACNNGNIKITLRSTDNNKSIFSRIQVIWQIRGTRVARPDFSLLLFSTPKSSIS